jgi:hypothetical protein
MQLFSLILYDLHSTMQLPHDQDRQACGMGQRRACCSLPEGATSSRPSRQDQASWVNIITETVTAIRILDLNN